MVGYNRHARPISNVLEAIDVEISFYLTKILGLVSILSTFILIIVEACLPIGILQSFI